MDWMDDAMKTLDVPIFDMHLHLPAPGRRRPWGAWGERLAQERGQEVLDLWVERARKRRRSMWKENRFPEPESPQPDPGEGARRYSQEVERYGLEGLCFATGGGNDRLAAALGGHSKLHGLAHHNPFDPDSADELVRAVGELGLVGYKVLAPALEGELSDPRLDPVWDACAKLDIPVLIHFGPLGGGGGIVAGPNISPLALHDVAKGWPHTPFIVPHFGAGYLRELLHLMWACDNVYVDTSGSNQWRLYLWPQPSLEELFKLFFDLFGAGRILFGTDSSHFPRGWVAQYAKEQLAAARQAGLKDHHLERVFRDNAVELLQVEGSSV